LGLIGTAATIAPRLPPGNDVDRRRAHLSATLALCRRIRSPARSGVVARIAAQARRCHRADADPAHRRAACEDPFAGP